MTTMTIRTTTTTTTRKKRRTRRCPRRSLLTYWGVGGGCTRHYPQLQSSYKMHFHLSTYLRMRPVLRGLFRSAPNTGRCASRRCVFHRLQRVSSNLSFALQAKICRAKKFSKPSNVSCYPFLVFVQTIRVYSWRWYWKRSSVSVDKTSLDVSCFAHSRRPI